ncbi:MAG: NAD(P)H-dependent oxidoreductase subunit E [Anaerolineae bacterium]|nr:NAD(P)H-dependent oxidoreductase subunit E [Chloroflexota bacterium]MBP6297962.1 NAD(P)H-dependent oxidoreductase subunit E [Anaerolineae bacterium]
MNTLQQKHGDRVAAALGKYPDKRSAVMPLLYIAQEEYGWVSPQGIQDVAELCDMDSTQVKSIAGFYTMYSEQPKGKFWLQVCTDLPCALKGADKFHKDLKAHLGVNEGGTTEDGLFTVEHVMCLAACDKAPMLQCNFHYYENLDMDKMKVLLDQWRAEVNAQVNKS